MNNHLKGVLYVATGAASYGILATFVKYANNTGVSTAGLSFAQYFIGAIVLTILSKIFSTPANEKKINTDSKKSKLKLVLFGSFLGLTSSFYYLSIQYVPVSIGIILLMQTIWMSVILEYFIDKTLVSKTKIMGAIAVIGGTILAAKVLEEDSIISIKGITLGLLAAASYTGTMYATNKIALNLPLLTRSKYLVIGGLILTILFWNIQIFSNFDFIVLLKWGAFLGFFGTILPPILFNKGIPVIGTGLGSIIAALEIPVSVFSAYIILNEQITNLQWLGIVIIIFSVIYINLKKI
ncbi:EamA family transporter [Cellulophaga sp. HaHaR_3_176]|uniref:EamA family transporter n=1 Tax=Cellulophaga sp. HaHaR_3_176 TaxID=1942464 RepID=UPI001C1F79E2|nr:EamA family transporter [Cellulophaga sp. HaHaR_3_176]QWX85365.1 EamA family transporter [Cellulophaga sp. HaHaR_3_176]